MAERQRTGRKAGPEPGLSACPHYPAEPPGGPRCAARHRDPAASGYRTWLPIVPASTNCVAERTQQQQDQADHQHDDDDRPQDRDLEEETHYEDDESENDHDSS